MYTKKYDGFLPSARVLSVFGVDRGLFVVLLYTILDYCAKWSGAPQLGSRGWEDNHLHSLKQHTFITLCSFSNHDFLGDVVGLCV